MTGYRTGYSGIGENQEEESLEDVFSLFNQEGGAKLANDLSQLNCHMGKFNNNHGFTVAERWCVVWYCNVFICS